MANLLGPTILARTMSRATSRGGEGHSWQYHSRSDTHSKVACWTVLLDLLLECDVIREHSAQGRLGFRINHVMVGPINKTLDLVQRTYSRSDRNAVFNTLAGYIDHIELAVQGRVRGLRIYRNRIRSGRLHVLMPADEMLSGQEMQLAAAQRYAESKGIVLQVEYAR